MDAEKIIDKVTDAVDDNILSRQEIEQTRTERQRIDNTSPFKLPHLIRPYITILAGVIWALSIIWTLTIVTILITKVGVKEASAIILDPSSIILYVLGATTTTFGTCIGFYFNARKMEKINAKKSMAAIQIEKEKAKVQISKERTELALSKKDARLDRKQRRRELRDEK